MGRKLGTVPKTCKVCVVYDLIRSWVFCREVINFVMSRCLPQVVSLDRKAIPENLGFCVLGVVQVSCTRRCSSGNK